MEKSEPEKLDKDKKNSLPKESRKNRKLIIIVIIILTVLVVVMGGYIYKTSITNNFKESKTLTTSANESFVFKTIKGQSFRINSTPKSFKIPKMQNRIVFLKVFGWDCKYCQKEIPELIKLKKQFDGAFDVIAIESQQHTTEENLKFSNEKNINYHIVTGNKHKRFLQYLKEHHGWSGVIPLSIVISEGGTILAFEIGAKSYTLAELLKVSLQQYKEIKKLQNNR